MEGGSLLPSLLKLELVELVEKGERKRKWERKCENREEVRIYGALCSLYSNLKWEEREKEKENGKGNVRKGRR